MGEISAEVIQAVDSIVENAMPVPDNEVKQGGYAPEAGRPQPDAVANDEKNTELRIKKHIQERDDARKELASMREQLARAQGEVATLHKFYKEPEAEDPTKDMTETEAALYQGIKALENKIGSITQALDSVQNVAVRNEYRNRESTFFQNNPQAAAERDKTKALIVDYVKDKPEIANRLLAGKIPLQRIYDLARLEGSEPIVNTTTQDSTKVFGTGRTEPAEPRTEYQEADGWSKAKKILNDPDSENKRSAIDFGVSEIAGDILQSMAV